MVGRGGSPQRKLSNVNSALPTALTTGGTGASVCWRGAERIPTLISPTFEGLYKASRS
jgi:hypothetical protein